MGLLSVLCSAIWLVFTILVSLTRLAEHLILGQKSSIVSSAGEFLLTVMAPFFSRHTLEKLRDILTFGGPSIVLGSKGDTMHLMPVYLRGDGATFKLGSFVVRKIDGVLYTIKSIMVRADMEQVNITISPVDTKGNTTEVKNEETVCSVEDVEVVKGKSPDVVVARDGMEMVARVIINSPQHVQKLVRKHQLGVAMRRGVQKFLGGFSMSENASLGCVDWRMDPDILELDRNSDFCVEYRVEKCVQQDSTMDQIMGNEWDVRTLSGTDGYRIILTLEVMVDSNQELVMKMHATLVTEKLDKSSYRTVCLRDTTNSHIACNRRLSDITADGASRGLTLAWDEFQTQSAENSPCRAPGVPSVTVSIDDMLAGSGGSLQGFPTTSTAFHSLERLLSSIPQSQLVFNSPIKEVSGEYTHLSTTAGTGPNTSTPADDLDQTGDHSRTGEMSQTHSRLDAPEYTPHSSPSLQGHKTVEEDITKKDSESNDEVSGSPDLNCDAADNIVIDDEQSTTPVPIEQIVEASSDLLSQDSSSPFEDVKENDAFGMNTRSEVKESDFVGEFVQVVFETVADNDDIDDDSNFGTSDAVKPSPNISMDGLSSPGRPQASCERSEALPADFMKEVDNNLVDISSEPNPPHLSPQKNSNLLRVQEYLQSLPSPARRDSIPETPRTKRMNLDSSTSISTPGVPEDCNDSQCSESQSVASRQSELSSLTGARRLGGGAGLFYGMTASSDNTAPVCPFPEDWQFNTIPESIENDDDLD